ncbi:MAG TPA: hypothetical protein VNO30_26950 [Kofleriaceae bacterium]|nr:hypothetical protein [Kofleriaceae bacterium]
MKCIRCHGDCKYPERSDGRCPYCKGEFAFEPRTGAPITDTGFKTAIDAVSSMGTVRFLPDHVYYEIARRKRSRGVARNALYGLGAAGLLLALANPIGLLLASFGAVTGTLLWPTSEAKLSRLAFDELWKRWIKVHGEPAGLIKRSQRAPATPYRGPTDIPSYSFDRAVICDRPQTVDVLLANNFHFENNCAVLSVDGYPPHAFDTVRQMLTNNPRLVVYVLHDATYTGCNLAYRLASDPKWFRGRARVVEVGLRPAHARKLRGVWQPPDLTTAGSGGTTELERRWLERHSLELASIRPEQVVKRLYAVIVAEAALVHASQYVDVEPGVDYYVHPGSFQREAKAADGGVDSFG